MDWKSERELGINGRISVVCGPNDLKFWQMVGLASGLVWYYMKKVGLFLKKQSFRRFSKKRRVKKKGQLAISQLFEARFSSFFVCC